MANHNYANDKYVLNVELRDIRTGGSLHIQIDPDSKKVESFFNELDGLFKWKKENSKYIFRYIDKDGSLAYFAIDGEFATVPISPFMIEKYNNSNSKINKRNTNKYIPPSAHLLIDGEFSENVPIEQVSSMLKKYVVDVTGNKKNWNEHNYNKQKNKYIIGGGDNNKDKMNEDSTEGISPKQ